MPTELIIFDCDGTLSDSEFAHNSAIADLLAELGYPHYTATYCLDHFAGKGIEAVIARIEQNENIRLPQHFVSRYMEMFIKKIPTEVKEVAHAVQSVEMLSKKYKVCVASNGERENVIESLKALELYEHFRDDRIFTKDQVARGKPAPDLFLFAATQKKATPESTLVIEDSVTGVNAGVAAGMRTIGITAASHNPAVATQMLKEAGAERVFASWPEVVDYIKQTCG